MATFLDFGILDRFEIIFPFLFVFVVLWGLLGQLPMFSDNKIGPAIIAFLLGLIALISDPTRNIINAMAPWFIVLIILGGLILFMIKSVGVEDDYIKGLFTGPVTIILLIVGVVIGVFSIIDEKVWKGDIDDDLAGDLRGETDEAGKSGFFAVMTSPALMGFILIMLIGSFAISQLTRKS